MRSRAVFVTGSVVLGVAVALWLLWFGSLRLLAGEGALPPESRLPDIPAGATVAGQSSECASGGCWRQLTLTPPPGQSPADLAATMDLATERTLPASLLDPAPVHLSATPRGDHLIVHIGYR